MDFALNLFIIIADQFMLFIINMLVARHAGEALFGDFSVATNALLLLSTLITLGVDSIIAYYVPKLLVQKKFGEIAGLTTDIKQFLKPVYFLIIGGGLLISLCIIAISRASMGLSLFEISHPLFLFLWATVALSAYNIYIQYFRAINYMRTAVIMSLLQTLCYFILSLIIYFYIYPVFFHGDRRYFPHIMLMGFIASYVLIVLASVIIIKHGIMQQFRQWITAVQQKWKSKIYGYTIQNLNKYVFAAIPLLVIEWLGHNEHSVGLFSAVSSIISLAFIAIAPIGILIGPDISAAFAESRESLLRVMKKYMLICFAISLVIMLVIGLFAKQILLLYQSNFIDALPYTYACLINVVTYAISMPLSKMIQYSHEGSEAGARLTIGLLLVQLISSIVLIHWLGLLGAVICYIGINIVYNSLMIIMAIRIYRIDPFGEEVI
ncbi:oligosaccharide flippase family protein [Legionella sp. CNM-4043-24]|uniref:oligosaccharide flippase family protein n=1 Tax=Legionella sp. CNM-4043-24 TaxID=3421646 RepID=UPI00403B1315